MRRPGRSSRLVETVVAVRLRPALRLRQAHRALPGPSPGPVGREAGGPPGREPRRPRGPESRGGQGRPGGPPPLPSRPAAGRAGTEVLGDAEDLFRGLPRQALPLPQDRPPPRPHQGRGSPQQDERPEAARPTVRARAQAGRPGGTALRGPLPARRTSACAAGRPAQGRRPGAKGRLRPRPREAGRWTGPPWQPCWGSTRPSCSRTT